MTRGDEGERPDAQESAGAGDVVIARLAHAFTPAEWSGRSLVVAIVVFALVGGITVLQRALVADDTVGWIITALHGAVVVVGVPLLSVRAVREWRAAQPSMGVPE